MSRYKKSLEIYATQVNDALRETLYQTFSRRSQEELNPEIKLLSAVMGYSLLDAGKRIRGALVLEFGRLSGASRTGAMALACAVEMIHAYSLIHDDLPCMDDDDFRRGKLSCHKAFGEANALLAGDALLTLAFETAAESGLPPERVAAAISALAKAAGAVGMVGGQMMDLNDSGKSLTKERLEDLYRRKTGAMLRVSAALGCIAGGASPQLLQMADEYTQAYGLAFQISDDILDVTGNQQTLGKPVGSDEKNHKTTYVTLLGLEGAAKECERLVEKAKNSIEPVPDHDFLWWLADMILRRDH